MNALPGLQLEGGWLDEPDVVNNEAKNYFARKFRTVEWMRLNLDGISFMSFSETSARSLEENFSIEELKEAVWSCAGDKSPGSDGINFRFIKSFWETLKGDFFDMAVEFQ